MKKFTPEWYACVDMLVERYRHLPKFKGSRWLTLFAMREVVDKAMEIVNG